MSSSPRRRLARLSARASIVVAMTAWSAASSAQEAPPPAPPEPAPVVTPAEPPPPIVAPPPPVVVAPRRAEPEPPPARPANDLDVEARRWAIGYTGVSQVPVGLASGAVDITIPALGLRYWVSETMGIDLGLGIGWTGGSTEAGGSSTDKDAVWGFVLQAGLPFALSTHRHVSFQVIPYAVYAHGQTSTSGGPTGGVAADFSGNRVDVGARAGLEVFFGFIGIPELSLSATLGAQFELRKYSADANGMTQSDTTIGFTTTVQNSPWDIFAGNVAARYYF
jgi:hypothetical protein